MFPLVQRWIDGKDTTSRTAKLARTSAILLCLRLYEFVSEVNAGRNLRTVCCRPNKSTGQRRAEDISHRTVYLMIRNVAGKTFVPQPA